MNFFAVLPILYVIIFGGAIGVFAKFALWAFSPLALIFIRIVLSLIFFTFLLIYKNQLKKTLNVILNNFPHFLLLAFSGVGLGMLLTFVGLNKTTAINYSLLFNAAPMAMIFFAALLFKEKIRLVDICLFLLALAGSFLIVTQGKASLALFDRNLFWGNILVFVGAAGWGFYSIYGPFLARKQIKIEPLVLLYGSFLIASIAMLPFILKMGLADITSLINLSEINPVTVIAALLMSILSTGLLFFIWFNLIKLKGGIFGSFIFFAENFTGVFLPIIFLKEELTSLIIIGGVMIILPLFLRELLSFKQTP